MTLTTPATQPQPALPAGPAGPAGVADETDGPAAQARAKGRRKALGRAISFVVSLGVAALLCLIGRYAPQLVADTFRLRPDVVAAAANALAVATLLASISDVRAIVAALGHRRAHRALNFLSLGIGYVMVVAAVVALAFSQHLADFTGLRPDVVRGVGLGYALTFLLGSFFDWRQVMRSAIDRSGDELDDAWMADLDEHEAEHDAEIEEALTDAGVDTFLARAGVSATGLDGVYELAERRRLLAAAHRG